MFLFKFAKAELSGQCDLNCGSGHFSISYYNIIGGFYDYSSRIQSAHPGQHGNIFPSGTSQFLHYDPATVKDYTGVPIQK